MRFELWSNPSGDAETRYVLIPADIELITRRAILDGAAVKVATFDASSWDDACRQQHELLGWAPYEPPPALLEEI